MNKRVKTAVLISGSGSNLQALIDASRLKDDYPAEISLVISNKEDAYGLTRAKSAGIESILISNKKYKSREEFDQAIHKALIEDNIEFVCLAGFMRLLTPGFVNQWLGKMINIHPSLLPKYKGAHAIRDALEDGADESGCTVHYVIPEMDAGEIILQRKVKIEPNDTEESLAKKIHKQEHIIYPEALKLSLERIRLV